MTPDQIERNYKRGTWTIQQVALAVVGGFLTPEKFKEITGADYVNPKSLKAK